MRCEGCTWGGFDGIKIKTFSLFHAFDLNSHIITVSEYIIVSCSKLFSVSIYHPHSLPLFRKQRNMKIHKRTYSRLLFRLCHVKTIDFKSFQISAAQPLGLLHRETFVRRESELCNENISSESFDHLD